jgi:hypothetical protein
MEQGTNEKAVDQDGKSLTSLTQLTGIFAGGEVIACSTACSLTTPSESAADSRSAKPSFNHCSFV